MPKQKPPYEQFSDTELLNFAGRNDLLAFDEIYRRHRDHLVSKAYRKLASRHLAEDLVQDIFISLYMRRASLEISIPLRGYLYKSLKYKILNELRAYSHQSRYRQFIFFDHFCKIDSANYLETRELYSRLNHTVARLSPKCKTVFLMSRKENQSHKVISENLNISVSTVEKHIVKALKIMRNSLDQYMN